MGKVKQAISRESVDLSKILDKNLHSVLRTLVYATNGWNIRALSVKLGISERSVRRAINKLVDAGFEVIKNNGFVKYYKVR